jgi:hypothetical protein
LKKSLGEAEQRLKTSKIGQDDIKLRSKILKELLNNFAAKEGIRIELRKKTKQHL